MYQVKAYEIIDGKSVEMMASITSMTYEQALELAKNEVLNGSSYAIVITDDGHHVRNVVI